MRDIFHLPHWFRQIEALDGKVSADVQLQLMEELMRLGRRATRWLLRSRSASEMDAAAAVAHFGAQVVALGLKLNELLASEMLTQWEKRYQGFSEAGVPELLARMVAGVNHLYTLLPIIEAADISGQSAETVARFYFALGSELELDWYGQQINRLSVENNWQAQAREGFRDELDEQQRNITIALLQMPQEDDAEGQLAAWLSRHQEPVQRWRGVLAELRESNAGDYAIYALLGHELLGLAQGAVA